MHDLAVSVGFPYGAPDLKKAYRKYLTIAEIFGIGVVGLLLGAYYLGVFLAKDEEPVAVDVNHAPGARALRQCRLRQQTCAQRDAVREPLHEGKISED